MDSSFSVTGENLDYIEKLYELFLENPGNVADEWRTYFEKNELGSEQSITYKSHRSAEAMMIATRKAALSSARWPGECERMKGI